MLVHSSTIVERAVQRAVNRMAEATVRARARALAVSSAASSFSRLRWNAELAARPAIVVSSGAQAALS